ncbi:MAG: hypothetical protein IK065_05735 [Neisseriaceae bacterium]|nr:hypothetical protein [Neisseriaceae bacterium]
MYFINLLQKWYKDNSECSFTLDNVDNPGWKLEVNGEKNKQIFQFDYIDEGTPLRIVDELNPLVNNDNWIVINANENSFEAYSGRINFPDLIYHFVKWLDFEEIPLNFRDGFLHFLQKWFFIKFAIQSLEYRGELWAIDLAWDNHGTGMTLKTIDNCAWELLIDGEYDKSELNISIGDETQNDWLTIEADDKDFKAICSNNRLPEMIDYWIKWEDI